MRPHWLRRTILQNSISWPSYSVSTNERCILTTCGCLAYSLLLGCLLRCQQPWSDGFLELMIMALMFAQLVCIFMGKRLVAASVAAAMFASLIAATMVDTSYKSLQSSGAYLNHQLNSSLPLHLQKFRIVLPSGKH